MSEASEPAALAPVPRDITLPGGAVMTGTEPVVVLGPNGSGKTRQARNIVSPDPIKFVNALRNTRVSPQLPAMGMTDARNNLVGQENQARANHWDITADFDYMLSGLLAEDAMTAKEFVRELRRGENQTALPTPTPLTKVEDIWGDVFPGRELVWKEWAPYVLNSTASEEGAELAAYSGNQMSDGEKAALYIAAKVFGAEPGVLVVDEPETHLHSLLAIRLWDALEVARPDLRFVYVTHDLTFALSRRDARYVLASPKGGLDPLDLGSELPDEVAKVLLGSATLSFYARRVVFCEGESTSLDDALYNAWFNGQDTVVRSVGSCEMVLRCVDALANSGIAKSLVTLGILDRDYLPDAFIASLSDKHHVLPVHEVESLLALPGVVAAVASHLGKTVDQDAYRTQLGTSITDSERHRLILERWKRRVEPLLAGVVSSVHAKTNTLDAIVADLPDVFDHNKWTFSPPQLLTDERATVEGLIPAGSAEDILRLAPGKKFLTFAAGAVGMKNDAYVNLVVTALHGRDSKLNALGAALRKVLEPLLPKATT